MRGLILALRRVLLEGLVCVLPSNRRRVSSCPGYIYPQGFKLVHSFSRLFSGLTGEKFITNPQTRLPPDPMPLTARKGSFGSSVTHVWFVKKCLPNRKNIKLLEFDEEMLFQYKHLMTIHKELIL